MMQTQAVDTMGRDGHSESAARGPTRSLRSAVRSSSSLVLAVACATAMIAVWSAGSSRVPLAAAVPVALLVAPSLVDLLDHRLPNRMIGAAAMVGGAIAVATVASGGELDARSAALGALAFAGPLLVMHLLSPSSMGFGDVKIAAVLGAALGLVHPTFGLIGLAAGSLLGAAAGLATRRRSVAFGPALVGGAVIALVLAASPVAVVSNDASATTDAVITTSDRPNEADTP